MIYILIIIILISIVVFQNIKIQSISGNIEKVTKGNFN